MTDIFFEHDSMQTGRWVRKRNMNKKYPWECNFYWVCVARGGVNVMLTDREYNRGLHRASRNPEDCSKARKFLGLFEV